jgi:tetratricopeptide (TPR) repeat protein
LTYPLADESLQLEKHIAGQLFVSAATQSMGGKFHAAPQAPSIAEICRQTEGMPLALRLAASQLPARAGNCKELADAIGACYRVLQTTARDVPSRHRSAQAVFETSWQVLDASLQTILAQLSLFKGGISPKAAQTVTGATEQQMGQLARRALLQIDESSGRFFLHALLRQFCAEKFLRLVDEVARQAKLAYLDFFASLAESAHANSSMLTGEWAKMLNATGVAHSAQHWQMVIRLTQNMAEAWNTAGRYTDARTAYALACDAAQKMGDDHALVGFLAQWGRACVRQADYAEAQHHFERGRELAHKPIDAMNIALIDYEMAQLDIELGRAQTAHERLDECLDIAEELNLASLIGETYRQKARVHYNTHDTENAESFARRALETHQTHSPPALQLLALRVLGDVIRELWALDRQERHRLEYESLWQTAMRLNTEVVKDAREECILRYSRLQFLRIRKEWDAFEQEWPECDRQLRRIGDRKTQIHLNTLRGYVFLEQNKFAQAVERIEQSVGWLTEANSADQTIHPLMQLSKSWQGLGNAGKAAACLQRARDTARRYGHPLLGKVEAALSALGAD